VTFVIDRENHRIVDPETGETKEVTHWHRQSDHRAEAIISPEGEKRFEVYFKNWSREGGPPLRDIGTPTRMIMTSATKFDAQGKPTPIDGPHPQIDRIVGFYLDRAASSSESFEFIDARGMTNIPSDC
jgi:hypothetical protein